MKPSYVKFSGPKFPGDKSAREYLMAPQRGWCNYGASYDSAFLKVDVDDYDHKTGELKDPVRGQPKSDIIQAILDNLDVRYNGICTEHGRHFFFRVPEGMEQKNKINWLCPLGIQLEWKYPASDDHIPLKVNGVMRKFFKGSIGNEEIDELPPFLWPIQKGQKPFDISFPPGGRTQKLGAYLFYLVNRQGFTADQAFQVVQLMNQYVFDDPIPMDTLEAQILNESTLHKLTESEALPKNRKDVSPETFKAFLDGYSMTIRYNELLNIVEYGNIPPDFSGIKDIQNVMPVELQYAFKKYTGAKGLTKQQVTDLIVLEADKNSFNPVRDYLINSEWDGDDYFPILFGVLGIEDSFQQGLIRKWFYQTVALAFNTLSNPVQPEGVLILQGPEGIGKTRFFKLMCPNPLWFSSLNQELSTRNKDVLIQTLGAWIAEVGEIDRTFRANKSDIKNFMTSDKDTVRKPYARESVTRARTTSFCGTTNATEFLTDDTGFRRWWVIPVRTITMGPFLNRDYLHQFWAQCYTAYMDDPLCFLLTDTEREELGSRNTDVTEMLPAEEELLIRMDFDAPTERWQWLQSAALRNIPSYDVSEYSSKAIGRALTKIAKDYPAVKKKTVKGISKYLIPPCISETNRYREQS